MPLLESSLKEKLKEQLRKSQARHIKNDPPSEGMSKGLRKKKLAKNEIKHSVTLDSTERTKNLLTPLQQSMALKLKGAQFRWLNEQLYTLDSDAAQTLLKSNPGLFDIYHEGFRDQAQRWPEHPLTWVLSSLLHLPTFKVIADLGCGDAQLAHTLIPKGYTVHSYDLVSKHPYVIQASMTKIPLESQVCDVIVYCLSLMNTDYAKAVNEGIRILKLGGQIHIVEVVSRISNLNDWILCFQKVGLKVIKKKTDHPLFLYLVFEKSREISCEKPETKNRQIKSGKPHACSSKSRDSEFPELKPCVYKRR